MIAKQCPRWMVVAAAWVCLATVAMAQSVSYRAEKWEFGLGMIYAFESDLSGEEGTRATIDDDLGFGLMGGYNFNEHFQLGGSFNWDTRSYRTTGLGDNGALLEYDNEVESTVLGLNGYYFILPGNFTPFVMGSVGYAFVDSNIQNGPTETYVYYDPWWGYTYDTYTPTRTESGLSYGLGIGLRYDLNENASLQLSYNKGWIDAGTAAETPDFDVIRFDFIGRAF